MERALQPMLTAFVDINKVESYFGNGEGLEHEN